MPREYSLPRTQVARPTATVTAFPRIHIGLVDLGRMTPRAYGGAGFFLDGPVTRVTAKYAQCGGLEGYDGRYGREFPRQLGDQLEQLLGIDARSVRLRIEQVPPAHHGFGSKTAFVLAALESAAVALSRPLSSAALIKASGRGGASGVGVNGYFMGGLVCDSGHLQGDVESLVPSSARLPVSPPPVALRLDAPLSWSVAVFLPPTCSSTSAVDEVTFFSQQTPTSHEEVAAALGAIYHGVVPAFVLEDLHLLSAALRIVSASTFKRREVEHHPEGVSRLICELSNCGAASGMSSIGPAVYAIFDRESVSSERLAQVAECAGATPVGVFRFRNQGREVEVR